MKSGQIRLYNVIFPVWLLMFWPTPPVILLTLLGNLAIDCLVVLLTLLVLRHPAKKTVLGQCWWKIWLLGFAADAIGVAWMFLGLAPALAIAWNTVGETSTSPAMAAWEDTLGHIMHNSFAHPLAFLWTLAAVALAGICIYFFDRRVFRRRPELDGRQAHILALTLAIATAPWLFFVPMYL